MRWLKFSFAVAITSLALVAAIAVIGVFTVQSALANPPWIGGMPFGHPGFGGKDVELPLELQGLGDLPPAERFGHFLGVQVSLKDKDNKPLTVHVTPGTATTVGPTALTISANDGTTRTFTVNEKTIIRGKHVQQSGQAGQPGLANGDQVVVVTLDGDTTAKAVVAVADALGPGAHGGPWGPWGPWGSR